MRILATPIGLAGFASPPKAERSTDIFFDGRVGESETREVV
jgi:hypothetical protein